MYFFEKKFFLKEILFIFRYSLRTRVFCFLLTYYVFFKDNYQINILQKNYMKIQSILWNNEVRSFFARYG